MMNKKDLAVCNRGATSSQAELRTLLGRPKDYFHSFLHLDIQTVFTHSTLYSMKRSMALVKFGSHLG